MQSLEYINEVKYMWLVFAFGSAIFAGVTSILAAVPDFVWSGYRGILAVLLPGLAGRPRQHRCPYRQIEYFSYSGLFRSGVPRKTNPPGCDWAAVDNSWNAGHVVLILDTILHQLWEKSRSVVCAPGLILSSVYLHQKLGLTLPAILYPSPKTGGNLYEKFS